MALQYEFTSENVAWLSFTRSYEPPTFDEIQNWTSFTILEAQEASTVELGTRGKVGRVEWDAAIYHSWVENEFLPLVTPDGDDLGTLNASDTEHFGIEFGTRITLLEGILASPVEAVAATSGKSAKNVQAAVEGQPGDKLDLLLTYNWNHFRFDNDAVYGKNYLGAVPEHYLRAELLYQHPKGVYFGPNIEWVMTNYYVDLANTLEVDSWAVLNFRIGYRSKKGFNLFLEARNLTDETYASSTNLLGDAMGSTSSVRPFYPGDGRSFYGGIEWKF